MKNSRPSACVPTLVLVTVLTLLLALSPFSEARTQTHTDSLKVVTRSTMLGIGVTRILDSYLSNEHFKGTGVTFLGTVERNRPQSRWSTILEHEGNFSFVKDRAGMREELEGVYNFYWGRLYRWQLFGDRLMLQAGGMVNASLGFIYNTSNSNNPAQARAHLNLMPTGVATYRFRLFNRQWSARYELALPLAGVMFSPNYGQSYYEIFNRGNYDHNVVLTSFVTAPEWRHMLTIDASISHRLTLRIGYLGNMQQYKVNNLRQHVYTHRFLIGLTKRFSIIPHTL